MMEEAAFPRGKVEVEPPKQGGDKKRRDLRSSIDKKKKKRSKTDDFLFGEKKDDETNRSRFKKPKQNAGDDSNTAAGGASKSMLPIGGGGTVVKGEGGWIEPLSFGKLHAGFSLLGCVKQVHEDLVIFSLPNLWTGYMLRGRASSSGDAAAPLSASLRVHDFVAVTIVKAVLETTKQGPRRRIQVKLADNPVDIAVPGLTVQGRIVSHEDHGVLVDLGLKRRGFLAFSEIKEGTYSLDADESDDNVNKNENNDKIDLSLHRILNVTVKAKSETNIVPLSLPNKTVKATMPEKYQPALQDLRPGTLISSVKVEQTLRNGLAVSFGAFRGAIELVHLGAHWIPKDKNETTEWKDFFEHHRVFPARLLAVCPKTKIIRLTIAEHLLSMELAKPLPETGTVVHDCTVLRLDPGLGALLALPPSSDDDDNEEELLEAEKKPLFKPLSKNEAYVRATNVQAVYVHISKAMDNDDSAGGGDSKTPDALFAKQFAPSTTHSVRIISTENRIEGIASGATAPSILIAHVLTHADIVAGKVYKQVPVCTQLEQGAILVDFGMGIRGLIPVVHLFDQAVESAYRTKMRKVKYSVGAKVDVRVLTVDTETKRCMLTAKKSLVKADDDEIITSYDNVKVGQKAIGIVTKVDDAGIFVTFFNNVFGRVTARSLAAELGVENHKENYSRGDVVQCRVVKLKKRSKRNQSRWTEDEMEIEEDDDQDDTRRYYHELTLSMKLDGEVVKAGDPDALCHQIQLRAGAVLPEKSLRVVELCPGKRKAKSFVPGYAVVSVKAKYMITEDEALHMPRYLECKLPFDQLLDWYEEGDVQSAATLEELASQILTVGKKINGKGLVLQDPKKSNSEYSSGTGNFAVVSIRPKLVQTAEQADEVADNDDEKVILPGPSTHFYMGALVQGYVTTIDPRHGAFVRFLDGMTGLVPKLKGGLHLKLYSTVVVEVVAVDDKIHPPRIMLGLTKRKERSIIRIATSAPAPSPAAVELGPQPLQPGDIIKNAKIAKLDFHRAQLTILDGDSAEDKRIAAQIHCTMVDSKPIPSTGKLSAGSAEQKISKFHPFYKWSVGETVKNLRVVSVERRTTSWSVELTNLDENKVIGKVMPEPKTKVSGIVTAISKNQGLWLQLSASLSTHVPGLEVSQDIDVLNNLAKYFPVGSRLEGVVMDNSVWEKTRGKYNRSRNGSSSKNKGPLVSLLGTESARPIRNDLIVARIDRFLPSAAAPDLMLDLRGGFVGRCCITELEEVDDWTNFPLGRAHAKVAKSAEDRMEIDDNNDQNSDTDDDNDKSDSDDAVLFAHGTFVRCRVLADAKQMVEVSLRQSRLEGDLDDDEPPEEGDTVQAYVVATSGKGCFVRLCRQIEGRTILKELCDGFLPNPAASFPTGRLVVGKIKAIRESKKGHGINWTADIDMRESILVDGTDGKVAFEDIEIGDKHKGKVTRIEDYGVFVRIDNSDVSGLVHTSQCSDKYIKSLKSLYDPGDRVKLLVLKKDDEKKQVGFSMKASHFEDDEDSSDDEASVGSESMDNLEAQMQLAVGEDLDSDDDNYASKLALQMNEMCEDEADEADDSDSGEDDAVLEASESSSDSVDSDEESEDERERAIDTNVGFDWNGASGSSKKVKQVSDDDSDSSADEEEVEEEEEDAQKSSHKSRKKQAERRREEEEITRRETALADGTADENPETSADFERMLAGDPNSSELWIRYMAFHLTLANIPAAREVAERGFVRIEFREEKEKLNVWCALLTLELKYGSEETLQKILDRACQHNNPKHVYLRMCEMMEKQSFSPDSARKADEMFAKMCKKFKSKKKVWIAYMEYLLQKGRHEEAQSLSKRALLSLKPYKHVETMSKYAQLVFEYGSNEKARTIFEGLLTKYPKRLDLISVYADKEVKHGELDAARSLFVRVANPRDETLKMKLSDKQMKRFFKKWFSFEEAHGTDETQEKVKDAAREFVERSS